MFKVGCLFWLHVRLSWAAHLNALGIRKCSSFILLQVVDQFSQHHLFKEIVFSPLYILASFVKDKLSIGAWVISGLSILFH